MFLGGVKWINQRVYPGPPTVLLELIKSELCAPGVGDPDPSASDSRKEGSDRKQKGRVKKRKAPPLPRKRNSLLRADASAQVLLLSCQSKVLFMTRYLQSIHKHDDPMNPRTVNAHIEGPPIESTVSECRAVLLCPPLNHYLLPASGLRFFETTI